MDNSISIPGDAKEIASSPENWINSSPLTIRSLHGYVILLDFWAYSCANCIRTIGSLGEIWLKHKDRKFMLVGIHTPEFEFEKNIYNLRFALRKFGIEYPVLHDPEGINWKNYGNNYWPRAALINQNGQIIFEHIGESGYDEIDRKIIELLGDSGKIESIREKPTNYPFFMSRETYAGSVKGAEIGSVKVCTKESCEEYYDPGNHKEGIIYPKGDWSRGEECLAFWGNSGYISLMFNSKEVNAVLDGSGHAEVLYHGEVIDPDDAGSDIIFKRGRSFVSMNGPRLYSLLKLDRYMPGEIKIIPFRGFRIYSYTFG